MVREPIFNVNLSSIRSQVISMMCKFTEQLSIFFIEFTFITCLFVDKKKTVIVNRPHEPNQNIYEIHLCCTQRNFHSTVSYRDS